MGRLQRQVRNDRWILAKCTSLNQGLYYSLLYGKVNYIIILFKYNTFKDLIRSEVSVWEYVCVGRAFVYNNS